MVNSFRVCLLLTFFLLQGNEGSSSSTQHRLLGGSTTNVGTSTDRYSMVSVRYSNLQGQFHLCGGFIINKRWIGTAAQCLEGQTKHNTAVAVGTTNIVLGTVYGIDKIEMHQNFNNLTLMNDIGLLRTDKDIAFPSGIEAAVLNNSTIVEGKNAIMYGWGQTTTNSNLSTNLLRRASTTMTIADCHVKFPFVARRFISDRHICTYNSAGANCPGDAGGPVYLSNKVIGIMSWVEPCVAGQVSVNIRLSSYYNWIKNVTGADD